MTMIAKGTSVRLKTTNGGETVTRLLTNYGPTSTSATFDFNGRATAIWWERIKSVEPEPEKVEVTS